MLSQTIHTNTPWKPSPLLSANLVNLVLFISHTKYPGTSRSFIVLTEHTKFIQHRRNKIHFCSWMHCSERCKYYLSVSSTPVFSMLSSELYAICLTVSQVAAYQLSSLTICTDLYKQFDPLSL